MILKDILRRGQKYTLVRFDEQGMPESRKFTMLHITHKLIKDSPRTLIVTSLPAHEAGWNKFIHIIDGEQFIIWEGHHEVNTSRIVTRTVLNNVNLRIDVRTFVETRWPHRDPRYLHRAKRSIKKYPIAENIGKIQEPERLLTYQVISS